MYESPESRQIIIKTGLDGVIASYSSTEVFLYPIIDNLILLLQKPLAIAFFKKSRLEKPIYLTLQDPELFPLAAGQIPATLSDRCMLEIPDTDYLACFHTFDTSLGAKNTKFNLLKKAELDQYRSLFRQLHLDESGLGGQVLKAISNSLDATEAGRKNGSDSAPRSAEARSEVKPLPDEEIRTLLEPLRHVLDEALTDFRHSPLIAKFRQAELPNFFCVVRTRIEGLRYNIFDYTARVLLSEKQAMQMASLFGDETREHFEYPLGMHARSLADSVFTSGVIDFSSEEANYGRDSSAGDSSRKDSLDWLRVNAERRIYKSIISAAKTFYVPIHISGVPWMAIFTLTPPDGDNSTQSWAHNTVFYQVLVPRIAERLRAGARRVYLQHLGDSLAAEIDHPDEANLLIRINKAWKRLAYVFPHYGIEMLLAGADCPDPIYLPSGTKVCLRMYTNPYYSRQIDYDLLDYTSVVNKCRGVIDKARQKKLEVDQRFKAEVLSQRHTIFNSIPLMTLENALDCDEAELGGSARTLVEDAKRITEVLRVSLWVALKKQEGSSPLPVTGVIQLLRWLDSRTPSFEVKAVLTVADDARDVPLTREELFGAFTILWNFWHNASKTYGDCEPKAFWVNAEPKGENLMVTFINEGEIDEWWADYLQGRGPSPNTEREKNMEKEPRGLEIAYKQLLELGWSINEVIVKGGRTHISLNIPIKEQLS